jgi:formylglycine-generating enzyme required for sulfatase activity
MLRGGSWNNNQRNARVSYRNNNQPDNFNNNIGFRLVVAPVFRKFLLARMSL